MPGTALTADDFLNSPWGLHDREENIRLAPPTTGASVFSFRSSDRRPRLWIKPQSTQSRAEIELRIRHLQPSIVKLLRLADLRPGWNSYTARVISRQNIYAAIQLLIRQAPGATLDLPEIVPTVRGGIQLEWHRPAVDIEVYINSPEDIRFFAASKETGQEFEGALRGNEATLSNWLFQAR